MSKHTPGPWTTNGRLIGTGDKVVAEALAGDGLTGKGKGPMPEEREANARLIAACPAMLEALELVVAVDGPDRTYQEMRSTMEQVRLALAKAKKVKE